MTIRYINQVPGISSADKHILLDTELYKKYDLMFVFLFAFCIRLIFWNSLGSLFSAVDGDAIEYYITSINFEPHRLFKLMWAYDHWYERTPLYVILLHLIQRQLIVQVILSSIGCVLMYKMNKIAGIMWTIYLQDIIYSFQYNKECALLFFAITAIYLFRCNKKWLVIVLPIIFSGFVSYGGVVTSSHAYSKGMMLNFWHLWQPSFNISIGYGKVFVYLQAFPYILAMLYFIRKVKIISVEFAIFAFLSILYSSIYSEPRYRELFMPLLFLYIAYPLQNYLKQVENTKVQNMKFVAIATEKYALAFTVVKVRTSVFLSRLGWNLIPNRKEVIMKLPY